MKPACMTAEEWAAWSAMNERLYGLNRSDSPCRDCTPLFHRDMLAGGMCDGQPLPEPERGGRESVDPAHLRSLSYAELRELRQAWPYHGGPTELRLAVNRAKWREYRQARATA